MFLTHLLFSVLASDIDSLEKMVCLPICFQNTCHSMAFWLSYNEISNPVIFCCLSFPLDKLVFNSSKSHAVANIFFSFLFFLLFSSQYASTATTPGKADEFMPFSFRYYYISKVYMGFSSHFTSSQLTLNALSLLTISLPCEKKTCLC